MENEKQELYSVEFYEETLGRLRTQLTVVQDQMDVTSFAIRSLESGLEEARKIEGETKENENA
jgi:hypothetical protein